MNGFCEQVLLLGPFGGVLNAVDRFEAQVLGCTSAINVSSKSMDFAMMIERRRHGLQGGQDGNVRFRVSCNFDGSAHCFRVDASYDRTGQGRRLRRSGGEALSEWPCSAASSHDPCSKI